MTHHSDHSEALSVREIALLRRRLLAWYTRSARVLPWRVPPTTISGSRHPNPYHVLVSEAMLQQTQVATVIGYFQRFNERFPTASALSQASEADVLKLWEGLGYYRRARLLWTAAKEIVARHEGEIPSDPQAIRALPGVGAYTAGALASIAFGHAVAAVDGNVVRVVSRVLGIAGRTDDTRVRRACDRAAAVWVSSSRPGDFNQALMELGATVCKPRNPACEVCPLQTMCRAVALKDVQGHGVGRAAVKVKPLRHRVLVLERVNREGERCWLMQKRPAKGLWSNMWQFITVEDVPVGVGDVKGESEDAKRAFETGFNARLAGFSPKERFEHRTTHRQMVFEVYGARLKKAESGPWANLGGGVEGDDANREPVWLTWPQMRLLPMSNPHRRVLAWLEREQLAGS